MRWFGATMVLGCGLAAGACRGTIGENSDTEGADAVPDPNDNPLDSVDCDIADVVNYLETSCGTSSCHGPGRVYPLLTREGLGALKESESRSVPGQPMVVPGVPEESWLYRKVAGLQGESGGALMPLGSNAPAAESALIARWIQEGAKTECDEPGDDREYDPNSLDQDELFTCDNPDAPRATPERLRRVDNLEFTHMALETVGISQRSFRGNTVKSNPLTPSLARGYPSYPGRNTLDETVLDALLLGLAPAANAWSSAALTDRRRIGYFDDPSHTCIEDAEPDSACRETFVLDVLRYATQFRTPAPEDVALLRAKLDLELSFEADRQQSLSHTVQLAFLLPESLFRSEYGRPDDGLMPAESMALALGRLLSSHPPGTPFLDGEVSADDPDADQPERGRLGAIRAAGDDGSILEPSVRAALFRRYAFGLSADRPDLIPDERADWIERRGAYWIAPNLVNFFRAWLDYELTANTKTEPAATSRFADDDETVSLFAVNRSFSALNSPTYKSSNQREQNPTIGQLLDDTVARAVVESHLDGDDVFRRLLTTTTFALPTTVPRDPRGYVRGLGAVFNRDDVADSPTARWYDYPPDERLGVLTHPAWLAAHGDNFEDGASLVLRGKWIREQLFCQTVPPLGLVMVEAQLGPSAPDLPARERVRVATEDGPNATACNGCHQWMNDLGHPFESFNHAGFLREFDRGGAVDATAVIDNLPEDSLNRSYPDTRTFIEALAASRYARRGFIRHAFRYFMARPEQLIDGCTLVEMENALDDTGSFIDMLSALVASDTFARRTSEKP
ncbi:MAG: DUF1588 domain-containing protein [Myxococcota bacterium]